MDEFHCTTELTEPTTGWLGISSIRDSIKSGLAQVFGREQSDWRHSTNSSMWVQLPLACPKGLAKLANIATGASSLLMRLTRKHVSEATLPYMCSFNEWIHPSRNRDNMSLNVSITRVYYVFSAAGENFTSVWKIAHWTSDGSRGLTTL